MRRVLVTGGGGFLGSHLCERLADDGAEVVSLDNGLTATTAAAVHPRVVHVHGDVRRPLRVDGPFDVVLHLASPASPIDYARHPVETLHAGSLGTQHALDVATAYDARFVLASTSEVYGDPQVHPQPESYWGHVNPVGPRSVYDEAKRYAEALTAAHRRALGTDTGIARIFNTYGPRMRAGDGRVVPAFVTQALAGEPLTVAGDGTQTRSLCYVDDTVEGLVALAQSGLAGPVNLGNDDEITVLDLARLVIDLTGSDSRVRHVDLPEDDPTTRCPDLTVVREQLHWKPHVPLEEGLRRTIAWFSRHGRAATPPQPAPPRS